MNLKDLGKLLEQPSFPEALGQETSEPVQQAQWVILYRWLDRWDRGKTVREHGQIKGQRYVEYYIKFAGKPTVDWSLQRGSFTRWEHLGPYEVARIVQSAATRQELEGVMNSLPSTRYDAIDIGSEQSGECNGSDPKDTWGSMWE